MPSVGSPNVSGVAGRESVWVTERFLCRCYLQNYALVVVVEPLLEAYRAGVIATSV